jgi:lysozyme family protein
MKKNFKSALKHVLVHEGGWADHPKDPGGATMKGVTLTTYRRHFGNGKGKSDLRNISDDELGQIYKSGYWNQCHCDELASGLDYAVFDAAVNSGPGRSAKWLQAAVGAKQDGGVGPKTLSKIKEHEPVQITNDMCDRRLRFLQSLRTWSTFGTGWGRRVEGVRATAIAMAGGSSPVIESITPSVDYKTVKKGSTGLWVRKLQEALEIHVDGKFGGGTDVALKAWQQENGLEPDGIAGRNTYRSLGLLA